MKNPPTCSKPCDCHQQWAIFIKFLLIDKFADVNGEMEAIICSQIYDEILRMCTIGEDCACGALRIFDWLPNYSSMNFVV